MPYHLLLNTFLSLLTNVKNKNIKLKYKKYQMKVTKMSSKYYQQYQSKYQNVKIIKNISKSIKIAFTEDHHDTK